MPTVTSHNKLEHDREFMEKRGHLKKNDESKEKDHSEHFKEHGFKELAKDYQWAKSHMLPDNKTKLGFNIKYAGTPQQYHVTRSATYPGLTGASQKMGVYDAPEHVTSAVQSHIDERMKKEK